MKVTLTYGGGKMESKQEISKNEACCCTETYATGRFHWHEKYELCRVLKRPCAFRVNGSIYEAHEGDIIAIPAYAAHQFIVPAEKSEITIMQFPMKILLHFGESVKPLKTHITCEEQQRDPAFFTKLTILFDLIIQEQAQSHVDRFLYMQSLMASFYLLLQSRFACVGVTVDKKRDQFFEIIKYVNEHFTKNITLSSIADELYISRSNMTNVFRKYAGQGVHEYINDLRIKKANTLIKQGVSITQAALESGFGNVRTFNQAYKNYMGMAPSEYFKE